MNQYELVNTISNQEINDILTNGEENIEYFIWSIDENDRPILEYNRGEIYMSIESGYNQTPPLSDVRVRKALSLAIDRNFIVTEVLQGFQIPTSKMLSFNSMDSENMPFVYKLGNHDIPDLSPNVITAQKLLAEAGYTNIDSFPELEIITNGSVGPSGSDPAKE